MTKMRAAKVCPTWSMAEIVWKSTRCRRRRTAWLGGFAFFGNAAERISGSTRDDRLNIATIFELEDEALSDSTLELWRTRGKREVKLGEREVKLGAETSPSDLLRNLSEPSSAAKARWFSPSFDCARRRTRTR